MVLYDYSGKKLEVVTPWVSSMHRGYSSSTVHENTLPAFYRAYLNGAQWIEVDARMSSDSVYVVNHDATVTVGGTTYTIASETASTLTNLVLSTDPTYGNCKLPTLESVLKLCCYTGMSANIDCKAINASTLAKLVVDTGMSGRVAYANTTTANAATILGVDPNAGFIFSYSDLATWTSAITDYHTRRRSYAWASTISNAALEATRAAGFKYSLSEVSSTTLMPFVPDMIEFTSTSDCNSLNRSYIDSLVLL